MSRITRKSFSGQLIHVFGMIGAINVSSVTIPRVHRKLASTQSDQSLRWPYMLKSRFSRDAAHTMSELVTTLRCGDGKE